MNIKKIPAYIYAFTLLCTLSLTFASEVLYCSPPSLSFDIGSTRVIDKYPTLYFLYNKSSLTVNEKPDQTVNLSLPQVGIKVRFSDSVRRNILALNPYTEILYAADVTGRAKVFTNRTGHRVLNYCSFTIVDRPNRNYYYNLPINFFSKVLSITRDCLTSRLCQALGEVPQNRLNSEGAIDNVISQVASKFRQRNNGRIDIPDIHTVFKGTHGTFEGLNFLQRNKKYPIRQYTPYQNVRSFTFKFGIPTGHVQYSQYGANIFMPAGGRLCADVKDLIFTAEIFVDFNQFNCRPTLTNFQMNSPGKSNTYTCGYYRAIMNPILGSFIDAWEKNIINYITQKVKSEMLSIVYENLNCQSLK